MRILSFCNRWNKLKQKEFSTFRWQRKDRDWGEGEGVQIYFKCRSPEGEKLGEGYIKEKTPVVIKDITQDEAIADGFNSAISMWLFLGRPNMNKIINKLTIRWA